MSLYGQQLKKPGVYSISGNSMVAGNNYGGNVSVWSGGGGGAGQVATAGGGGSTASPSSTQVTGGGGSPFNMASFDYKSDPIFQLQRQEYSKERTRAGAEYNEDQKKFLLQFGLQELAKKYYPTDATFIDTISSDPAKSNSLLARMNLNYTKQQSTLEDELNQQNLFYGGFRGKQLAELSDTRLRDIQGATSDAEGTLTGYGRTYANALDQIRMQELAAMENALNRGISLAAGSAGYGDMGGYGGGGGGEGEAGGPTGVYTGNPTPAQFINPWNAPAAYQQPQVSQAPKAVRTPTPPAQIKVSQIPGGTAKKKTKKK